MELQQAKMVVIVTEALISDEITKLMTDLGVDGYTVQSATGKGERGVRSGDDHSGLYKNVRIEAITSEEIAEKVAFTVLERYFDNYAGIVFLHDVEILRVNKFHVPE